MQGLGMLFLMVASGALVMELGIRFATRHNRRNALNILARNFGLVRKRGETDGELKERIRVSMGCFSTVFRSSLNRSTFVDE